METTERDSVQGDGRTSDPLEDKHHEHGEPPKKVRRKFLTQNACTRCRKKKSKCDGVRPVCGRCTKDGGECIFDVLDGMTRMQNLQQLLEKRDEAYDRLMILFNAFQHGTDDLASELLARLRLGDSLQSLVSFLEGKEGLIAHPPDLHPQRRESYSFGSAGVPSDTLASNLDPELLEGQVERSLTLEHDSP